jgi:hypothetical protein
MQSVSAKRFPLTPTIRVLMQTAGLNSNSVAETLTATPLGLRS